MRDVGDTVDAVDVVVARVASPPPRPRRRVLVDRLWPRGLRKDQAPWDEWLKDVAPSAELRRWYGHDPARYAEFRERYRAELQAAAAGAAWHHLLELAIGGPLALLTATSDVEHSQAPVLAEFLRERFVGPTARDTGRPEGSGAASERRLCLDLRNDLEEAHP